MLEGLEIKEVMFDKINSTELVRLESEFYTAKSFDLINPFSGEEIIDLVQYGTSKELNEENDGYPILRLNEFDSSFISKPSKYCDIIDEKTFQSLKLLKNDVLICRTNGNFRYVGKSALVPKDYEYAYASYLFKIRPKNEMINSSTLVSFLNSKYGRIEIEKYSMASNQVNFSPAKFRQLRIPRFSEVLNKFIENLTYNSFENLQNSKQCYSQAENLLLQEIGLKDFTPSKEPVNVKSFKDSFATSGRLDAEYYQLKYEQVVNKVKDKSYDTLQNLVDINKSIEPGSKNYAESGLPFMRVADLSKNGLSEPQKFISDSFIKENRDKISDLKPKKGTILFSKDGSVGIAYHLRQNYNGITSGAILHLNIKDEKRILPEYLTLALNSKVVQMQAERDAGGSIILHWRVGEIENVVVPIIDFDKQQQIANLIEESFALKKQSEYLLEVAKKAVEIAIEENEEVAIAYINNQSNSNG
ncbi:restriction endonuclease subunit S [Tenacibaculum tangerinum]|uniref:Restriction endonuclease subunit S n=1 Tax=Tenacibaculum tangerinum TaxID=3038772 RepID=A0ABY8L9I2_9FLAO|nr:restriction endonuclease subunit S [Tenacibaculum tangerinum]WGH76670.1 restriction endonuclease subunit S [Tenacibaculum tangerinum]